MKNLVTFIIGIVLVGIGSVICVFELMEYKYVDEPFINSEELKLGSKTVTLEDSKNIVINLPTNERYSYNIVYDENLTNKIIIKYNYLENVYDLKLYESNYGSKKVIDINPKIYNWNTTIREYIKVFIDNLKDKKIFNYGYLNYGDIEIIVNPIYKDNLNVR